MKIYVDNDLVFELNETQKKVICNDINESDFDQDMKRRLEWVIMQKYEHCYKRLRDEWMPKLADAGVEMIPLNKDAFAELVFAQPSYKDRSEREGE